MLFLDLNGICDLIYVLALQNWKWLSVNSLNIGLAQLINVIVGRNIEDIIAIVVYVALRSVNLLFFIYFSF